MSVRQRVPFKFSEEAVEDGVILDEQEQEELIQDLKKQSDVQNSQYLLLIQTVLALSGTLHLVYLFGSSKEPPTAAIFPRYLPPDEFNPIPGYHVFTLLHLFVHLNLSGQVLPTAHPLRRWFSRNVFTSSPYTFFIPLPYLFLFGIAALAPILSLFMRNGWHDVVWWAETAALTWFVYSAQGWIREESESLRTLEGLRYDAKGA